MGSLCLRGVASLEFSSSLGAIFWGAGHVQSHALCWVCSSNAGLGRSLGVLWSARGVECLGSSVSRCTTGVSSLV